MLIDLWLHWKTFFESTFMSPDYFCSEFKVNSNLIHDSQWNIHLFKWLGVIWVRPGASLSRSYSWAGMQLDMQLTLEGWKRYTPWRSQWTDQEEKEDIWENWQLYLVVFKNGRCLLLERRLFLGDFHGVDTLAMLIWGFSSTEGGQVWVLYVRLSKKDELSTKDGLR